MLSGPFRLYTAVNVSQVNRTAPRYAPDAPLRPVCSSRPSAGEPFLLPPPQVNRAFSSNSQSTNALLQITRYTCGSASAANVPENALSPRCPLLSPPQVNRTISPNSHSVNALPQITRYTCENTSAANVPENALSPRCPSCRLRR